MNTEEIDQLYASIEAKGNPLGLSLYFHNPPPPSPFIQKYENPPKPDPADTLVKPVAVVYSGGRGLKIGRELLKALTLCTPPMFIGVDIQSPDQPISQDSLDVVRREVGELPDAQLVFDWLTSTVEGRPGGGDWLYASSQPVELLAKDIHRIATLKLRPFFLDLLTAHRAGVPHVDRLLVARDTAQGVKLEDRDIIKYQPHPGNKVLHAYAQTREVENAEYCCLLTTTLCLGGRFPTADLGDIYHTMSTIYAIANQQVVDPLQIPPDLHMVVLPLTHFALWRLPDQYMFRYHPEAYANVPGGLNFDFWPVHNSLEFCQFQGRVVQDLALRRGVTFAEMANSGTWIEYRDLYKMDMLQDEEFTQVRCGYPPVQILRDTVQQINQFTRSVATL